MNCDLSNWETFLWISFSLKGEGEKGKYRREEEKEVREGGREGK